MNYCIVVPNTASKEALKKYAGKTGVDTLFIGSSVGMMADVNIIDSLLGTNSVNLSTNDQLYTTNYDAIRFVASQQPLKRVVLVTELDSIQDEEHYISDKSFKDALYHSEPYSSRFIKESLDKLERYKDTDFWKKSDSINIWFDWVKCPLKTFKTIRENYSFRRAEANSDEFNYSIDVDYKPYTRIEPDINEAEQETLAKELEFLKEMNITCFEIEPESFETLDMIIRYLVANNIEPIVMVSPHRLDDRTLYEEDYGKIDIFMKYFVENRGGKYINLDTDEEIRNVLNNGDYFKDAEHLNEKGREVIAPYIADRLKTLSSID